jgi:hypothetical protein
MEKLPLPSHIHYEMLLQLLERRSSAIANHQPPAVKQQVRNLVITLRKALAQQKQIETSCEQLNIPFEHRWSIHRENMVEDQER